MSLSATLTVVLAPPKAAKAAAKPPTGDAPPKRVRTKAAPLPAPLVFQLRRVGSNVVIVNPAGWLYALSPKSINHYDTSWEDILGIPDRVAVASAVLTVGDKTLLDVKKIGSDNLAKMLHLYSMLHFESG